MTIARPPNTPVAIGALAGHHRGRHFKPTQTAAVLSLGEGAGCGMFVETGLWLRPSYFPRAGERDWLETVTREVKTVRSAVGVCDVSTLGKVDVQGADAALFLDRLYMNGMKTIPVGKARYGAMLREDGIMMDDGTIARLGEHHYFVTTTTANAVKAFQHMEFCSQWLWPELDVQVISATEQWAQYAVAGPSSREVLQKIVDPEFDISDEAFPYLAVGEVDRLRRHQGAALPPVVLRRARLRNRRARPLRRRADAPAHGGGTRSSASFRTAPRRLPSCASRRATSAGPSSTA